MRVKATGTGDFFTRLCKELIGAECVKEYKFHDTRRWRFDYAFPEYKIAVEIDGGVWNYGRHNRAKGYIADMEKFNEAAKLGWVVLKFTPQEQYRCETFEVIRAAINTARERKDKMNNDGEEEGGL